MLVASFGCVELTEGKRARHCEEEQSDDEAISEIYNVNDGIAPLSLAITWSEAVNNTKNYFLLSLNLIILTKNSIISLYDSFDSPY